MNPAIREYLRSRNRLVYLSMAPLAIVIIVSILLSRHLLTLLGLQWLWLMGIFVTSIIPIIYLLSCITNYINAFVIGPEMQLDPYEYLRVCRLIKPILDQCRPQKTIYLVSDPYFQGLMGERSNATTSLIHFSKSMLSYPDFIVQAVLAHEVGHSLAGDTLKSNILDTLKITMAFFLCLTIIISIPLLSLYQAMIMIGLLYPAYLFLGYVSSVPKRLMEDTADGVATLMGFGEGLKVFLIMLPRDDRPKILSVFDDHNHNTIRLQKVIKLQGIVNSQRQ